MLEALAQPVTFALALGSGLIAGAFFAFSSFVMGALGRLPTAQGVAAMQSINVVVINPVFLGIFIGTALIALLAAGYAGFHLTAAGLGWVLVGALLYLIGCFGVTVIGNIPLNDALMRAAPDSAEAATFWARYLKEWVFWNHARTLASLGSSAAFIWAFKAM